MTEQRRDGFQAHPTVDRLCGKGTPQLVRMNVAQPGRGLVDQPSGGVPVERPAVFSWQQRMVRLDVGLAVVIDQRDQVRVQGQVTVVVEFADGDVQPVTHADEHDGIRGEVDELADPQPGA